MILSADWWTQQTQIIMYNQILSWPNIDSKSLGPHGVFCLTFLKKRKWGTKNWSLEKLIEEFMFNLFWLIYEKVIPYSRYPKNEFMLNLFWLIYEKVIPYSRYPKNRLLVSSFFDVLSFQSSWCIVLCMYERWIRHFTAFNTCLCILVVNALVTFERVCFF